MLLVFVYFSVCSGTASKEERQRDKEKNDGGGGGIMGGKVGICIPENHHHTG